MVEFEQAWIVMCRDQGELDGDQLDVVDAIRVFWAEDEARAEVDRLSREDPNEDRYYYYEASEVARRK